MGLQMIVISSSALAMLGLVNRQGVDTTAAFGVAKQLWTYVQMPAMALGAAVSAMAAQNIGAGNWDRVAKITRTGVLYDSARSPARSSSCSPSPTGRARLFLGGTAPAMPIARHIQLLATWGFLFFGVTMVLFGTVRANGEVIWPLIILAIGLYPVRLGFAFGASDWLGADALWLSFPVGHGRQPRRWPSASTCKAAGGRRGWRRCTAAPTRWNAASGPRRSASPAARSARRVNIPVIPAKAGVPLLFPRSRRRIPAFAGMTIEGAA